MHIFIIILSLAKPPKSDAFTKHIYFPIVLLCYTHRIHSVWLYILIVKGLRFSLESLINCRHRLVVPIMLVKHFIKVRSKYIAWFPSKVQIGCFLEVARISCIPWLAIIPQLRLWKRICIVILRVMCLRYLLKRGLVLSKV